MNASDGAMLEADEIERYARHLVLREVGGPGQAALKRARVLVIGAGGLGAPVLLYLAAAGVGTLGVIDDDAVSLSNLQRQVIHATGDVGRPKVESAAAALGRLNPHVGVEPHAVRLTAANALDARFALRSRRRRLRQFRHPLSRVRRLLLCASRPLVTAAVGVFDGTLTTIRAHEKGPRRQAQPDLSLPVSGAAAAGHGAGLRGGRHPRRAHRRGRLD